MNKSPLDEYQDERATLDQDASNGVSDTSDISAEAPTKRITVGQQPNRNAVAKTALLAVITAILCIVIGAIIYLSQRPSAPSHELSHLPKPELSAGQRGELGIDKNINETTIDNYLGRPDSIYYDMRMLEDPANYEKISGDRYLSGYVRGFEVIPYPYLATVSGLPEEVGAGYDGPTLFTIQTDGTYTANYQESANILAGLFPQNKNIFLMCGGGGYAGMTKKLLVSQGWDADKIYVVGGYWYYEGQNKVEVKQTDDTYTFWKVPYHNIDFTKLTKL